MGYSSIANSVMSNFNSLNVISPMPNLKYRKNNGHWLFKVTTFSISRKPVSDFLRMNNTDLHLIVHRFRDIADYWSNCRCRQESASV